jgi:hypothetical protein
MSNVVVISNELLPVRMQGQIQLPKEPMYTWLEQHIEAGGFLRITTEFGMRVGSRNLSLKCWETILINKLKELGEPIPSYLKDLRCKTLIFRRGITDKWQYFQCFHEVGGREKCQSFAFVENEMKALEMKLAVA